METENLLSQTPVGNYKVIWYLVLSIFVGILQQVGINSDPLLNTVGLYLKLKVKYKYKSLCTYTNSTHDRYGKST